ncbi:MAG: 4Fe-4S ferredoxin iron-sulfur binding domain protein [Nitrososphaeraceae archaeon]|nr:4Fe-4S ferredoxin iron-sulfur binding domain protein [Nitrososphaeraceae archaeon]
MISEVAKRGVYPLHGSRLGVFRVPVDITDHSDISGIMTDLKNSGFVVDAYADRIYATYKWNEKGIDPLSQKELSADLLITVEIVTGEVVDIIYQIKPLEFFGDPYWIRNYRQKADQNAKMVIDTIIRNTKIGDKLIAHYQKTEKLSLEAAMKKLEELTPLAKNPKLRATTTASSPPSPSAAPKPPASISPPPAPIAPTVGAGGSTTSSANTTISLTGNGTNYSKVDGPIDPGFKSQMEHVLRPVQSMCMNG